MFSLIQYSKTVFSSPAIVLELQISPGCRYDRLLLKTNVNQVRALSDTVHLSTLVLRKNYNSEKIAAVSVCCYFFLLRELSSIFKKKNLRFDSRVRKLFDKKLIVWIKWGQKCSRSQVCERCADPTKSLLLLRLRTTQRGNCSVSSRQVCKFFWV